MSSCHVVVGPCLYDFIVDDLGFVGYAGIGGYIDDFFGGEISEAECDGGASEVLYLQLRYLIVYEVRVGGEDYFFGSGIVVVGEN